MPCVAHLMLVMLRLTPFVAHLMLVMVLNMPEQRSFQYNMLFHNTLFVPKYAEIYAINSIMDISLSGKPFECQEEVWSLQPMSSPNKRFDIFPPDLT